MGCANLYFKLHRFAFFLKKKFASETLFLIAAQVNWKWNWKFFIGCEKHWNVKLNQFWDTKSLLFQLKTFIFLHTKLVVWLKNLSCAGFSSFFSVVFCLLKFYYCTSAKRTFDKSEHCKKHILNISITFSVQYQMTSYVEESFKVFGYSLSAIPVNFFSFVSNDDFFSFEY